MAEGEDKAVHLRGKGQDEKKGLSETKDRIIRIVLVILLAVVVLVAVRWRMLSAELTRCVLLYNDYYYEEAAERLERLMEKPVAAIRIRARAERILLLCRAELAGKERTLAGYKRAVDLFERAVAAGVPARDVSPRVKEFAEYIERLEAAGKKPKGATAKGSGPAPGSPSEGTHE